MINKIKQELIKLINCTEHITTTNTFTEGSRTVDVKSVSEVYKIDSDKFFVLDFYCGGIFYETIELNICVVDDIDNYIDDLDDINETIWLDIDSVILGKMLETQYMLSEIDRMKEIYNTTVSEIVKLKGLM